MMSRIVTTRNPAPILPVGRIQNRASSQSCPRNTSIRTAMPRTAPRIASPISAEMIVRIMAGRSLVVAGPERRDRAVAGAVVVAVAVAGAVRGRWEPREGRRQHRQHPAGVDHPAVSGGSRRPVALAADVRDLG